MIRNLNHNRRIRIVIQSMLTISGARERVAILTLITELVDDTAATINDHAILVDPAALVPQLVFVQACRDRHVVAYEIPLLVCGLPVDALVEIIHGGSGSVARAAGTGPPANSVGVSILARGIRVVEAVVGEHCRRVVVVVAMIV